MSDWRSQVSNVEWRYVKDSTQMDIRYWLEARTIDCQEWSRFGAIDMDCAGEGYGEDQAREIVETHNARLEKAERPETETGWCPDFAETATLQSKAVSRGSDA